MPIIKLKETRNYLAKDWRIFAHSRKREQ